MIRNLKYKLIVITVVSLYLVDFGQNTFEKIYSTSIAPKFYRNSNLILLPDSGYAYTATNDTVIIIGRLTKLGSQVWSKQLTDINQYFNSNIALSSSNFIYQTFQLNNPNYGIVVMKIDLNGNIIWSKKYNDANQTCQNIFVTSTSIFITGKNGPNNNLYVEKLDTNGNLIWGETFDSGTNIEYSQTSKQLKNKDILLSGFADFTGGGFLTLTRIDTNGTVIANKRFRNSNYELIEALAICEDKIGNILITGRNDTPIGFGFGQWDILLMKLDPNLNLMWAKIYGGTECDEGYSIFADHNNGIKIIAEPESFITSRIAMMHLDNSGNLGWMKLYGKSTGSFPNYSVMNKDRGFTIFGTNSDYNAPGSMLLIRTDSIGNSTCPHFTVSISQNTLALISDSYLNTSMFGLANPYSVSMSNFNLTYFDDCNLDFITSNAIDIQGFKVYPNPFISNIKIDIENQTNKLIIIEIRDFTGNLILSKTEKLKSNYSNELDLSYLPSGIYFIHFKLKDRTIIKKIFKE